MLYEPLPDKKYSVIMADPPWSYRDKASAGKRGASFKYPTLTIEQLHTLPVKDIASEDCALFLWATFPCRKEAMSLIESWGFEYKTVGFLWIKLNKKALTPFMGMGNWTRANGEECLIATKGKPKRVSASVHQVIMSPIEQHSKKPDEVRDRIVQLMGDVTRIELFARNRTEGWDSWGNEI